MTAMSWQRPRLTGYPSLAGVTPAVACVLISVAATLGLFPQFPFLKIVPFLVIVSALGLAVFVKPPLVIPLSLAVPFLTFLPRFFLLQLATLGLLFVAGARGFPRATSRQRARAQLVMGTGVVAVFTGAIWDTGNTSTFAVAFAIMFATMLGGVAVLLNPLPSTLCWYLSVLGAWVSVAALSSSALATSRTTVVLGENANGLGYLAAIGVIASLVLSGRSAAGKRVLPIVLPVAVLCAAGVWASGSRGAFLTAGMGVATILLHKWLAAGGLKAVAAALALLLALGFGAPVLADTFLNATGRQQAGARENVIVRKLAARYALHAGLSHPLTGVGLGRLAEVSYGDQESGLNLSAHNAYVGAFAGSGAAALAGLLLISVSAALTGRRHSPGLWLPLVLCVLVGGLSLEWWGVSRSGAVSMMILGAALGRSSDHRRDESPQFRNSTDTNHLHRAVV